LGLTGSDPARVLATRQLQLRRAPGLRKRGQPVAAQGVLAASLVTGSAQAGRGEAKVIPWEVPARVRRGSREVPVDLRWGFRNPFSPDARTDIPNHLWLCNWFNCVVGEQWQRTGIWTVEKQSSVRCCRGSGCWRRGSACWSPRTAVSATVATRSAPQRRLLATLHRPMRVGSDPLPGNSTGVRDFNRDGLGSRVRPRFRSGNGIPWPRVPPPWPHRPELLAWPGAGNFIGARRQSRALLRRLLDSSPALSWRAGFVA
jgi:hypothetical protein